MAFKFLWNSSKKFLKQAGKLRIGNTGDPCCCGGEINPCTGWDGVCNATVPSYKVDLTGPWDLITACSATDYGAGSPAAEPRTHTNNGGLLGCQYIDNAPGNVYLDDGHGHLVRYLTGEGGAGIEPTNDGTCNRWRLRVSIDGPTNIHVDYWGPSNISPVGTFTYAGDDRGGCSAGKVPPTITVTL